MLYRRRRCQQATVGSLYDAGRGAMGGALSFLLWRCECVYDGGAVLTRVQERWAEAKKAEKTREVPAHEHAVYALECRCEADNCIGRLFH